MTGSPLLRPLGTLLRPLLGLLLVIGLGFGLSGCVTTGLPMAATSPWQPVALATKANPLDVAFTDSSHGFLVGSNRLILETNDGGASWAQRALDLPEEENFRLLSIDFNGKEGWIAGQPGLLLHSTDAGQSWSRLFLDTKLPGEPYLITALGKGEAELATNVGAVYNTRDGGQSWQAEVSDAAGAVRDLRRSPDGRYVSVSSLGNFFATWDPGQPTWQPHQRVSSQRVQSLGFQPNGNLWMVTDRSSRSSATDLFGNNGCWLLPRQGDAAGEALCFAIGPNECELCGLALDPAERSLLLAVQHPGEANGTHQAGMEEVQAFELEDRAGGRFSQLRQVSLGSNWPSGAPGRPPRPGVVVIRRLDGSALLKT